jgi:hypothetical protein
MLSSTGSKDNNSNLLNLKSSKQVILPPPPYDDYMMDGYKAIVLEEAEKLYNVLVDQLVCEVVNETVSKQPTEDTPSLPFEGIDNKEHSEQNC